MQVTQQIDGNELMDKTMRLTENESDKIVVDDSPKEDPIIEEEDDEEDVDYEDEDMDDEEPKPQEPETE